MRNAASDVDVGHVQVHQLLRTHARLGQQRQHGLVERLDCGAVDALCVLALPLAPQLDQPRCQHLVQIQQTIAVAVVFNSNVVRVTDPVFLQVSHHVYCRGVNVLLCIVERCHGEPSAMSSPSRRLGVNRFDYRDSNRRSSRIAALAAGGLIGAAAIAGCGAGQLSQTSSQESAVDGSAAVINNPPSSIALRDVRIRAQQNSDYLNPGTTVDLVLVAVNQSPDVADKLVGISTDIGKVTVTGDPTLPAGGTLFVGTPNAANRKAANVAVVETAGYVKATVALSKPITNGPNYNFTFNFEKAGSVSLAVPISAPEVPPLLAGSAAHP